MSVKRVVLTGYMGTGKSTVGRLLAEHFGLHFTDTDAEVEARLGEPIAEFWARCGENDFRRIESDVWQAVLDLPGDRVIATGGGLLASQANVDLLSKSDLVFTLVCSPEELARRLWPERALRPRLAESGPAPLAGVIAAQLEARRTSYGRYRAVETDGRTPDEVAGEIARLADLERAGALNFEFQRQSRILFAGGMSSRLSDVLTDLDLRGDVLLVADEGTRAHGWAGTVARGLIDAGRSVSCAGFDGGEAAKTLDSVALLLRRARDAGLDRSGVIVGLGGGVVGDVAGLVAATYLRGVELVLVPGTLLAMVDASIGGKVGVDLEGVKNLVGAFHPARAVVADPTLLATLPDALLSDGLAEMIKIAAVRSATLLAGLEAVRAPAEIRAHPHLIRGAMQEKAAVVAADPFEQGERALLNFGHTVGHGIESAAGFRLSHGGAISVGMVAETWLAERLGLCDPDLRERLEALLARSHLPRHAPGVPRERAVEAMRHDKKREGSTLRFALPVAAGNGQVVRIAEGDARAAVEYAVRSVP